MHGKKLDGGIIMGKLKRTMSAVSNRIMYSCQEATYTVSKSFHKKLTFAEKQKLKMHLAMCKPCREFKTQNETINTGIKKLINSPAMPATFKLSQARKDKIKQAMSQQK